MNISAVLTLVTLLGVLVTVVCFQLDTLEKRVRVLEKNQGEQPDAATGRIATESHT